MAKKKVKKQDWEIIDTPYGQWEYPGAITRIPSNDITMQGVPYPVLGVSDTNDIQMMYPNQDYQFDGSSVTEYPVMEPGGRPPIITHNPNDPRLRAYNDSVLVSQIGDRARKYIKQFPGEDQWVGDYLPNWEDRNADISKAWNRLGKVNKTFPKPSNITSIYTDSHIYDYKKPVQPVLYRPNEKIELNSMEGNLQSQPIDLGNINPLPFEPGSYFTRERKPQEADRGKMEYFDKKTGRSIGLYANGGRIPKAQIGTLTPGSSIGIDMPTDLEPLTGLDLAFSKQERIPIQGNEELYNTVINNPKRYNFRIVDGRFFNYLPKEETPIQIKSKKPDLLQSQSTTPRKLEFTRERQPGERFSALYTPQGQKYSAIDVNDKSGKLIRTVDPKTGKIAFKHPVTGEEQFEYGGELPEAGSGYKVVRSSERKGKTHKVTGPDGTVKFFGDSKLGQHPKDPERKKAFYARHKKNLAGNPYFRAFARKTWEEGGELNDWEILDTAQDGTTILSYLNPKNWGVADYTNTGNFDSAYSAARKAGEKEFMFNNKRYNTKYAGTPKEQLKQTGITDDQIQGTGFIKDRLYKNLKPVGYENPGRRVYDAVVKNKKDDQRDLASYGRLDAFNLYMGVPQTHNTFEVSDYKPSISKGNDDNTIYYKKSDNAEEYLEDQLGKKSYSDYMLEFIGDDGKLIDKTKKSRYDEIAGNYTINLGKDDKGNYISYYDKWDLNPYELKNPITGKEITTDIGKPFEIYDRIYYQDNPKYTKEYSENLKKLKRDNELIDGYYDGSGKLIGKQIPGTFDFEYTTKDGKKWNVPKEFEDIDRYREYLTNELNKPEEKRYIQKRQMGGAGMMYADRNYQVGGQKKPIYVKSAIEAAERLKQLKQDFNVKIKYQDGGSNWEILPEAQEGYLSKKERVLKTTPNQKQFNVFAESPPQEEYKYNIYSPLSSLPKELRPIASEFNLFNENKNKKYFETIDDFDKAYEESRIKQNIYKKYLKGYYGDKVAYGRDAGEYKDFNDFFTRQSTLYYPELKNDKRFYELAKNYWDAFSLSDQKREELYKLNEEAYKYEQEQVKKFNANPSNLKTSDYDTTFESEAKNLKNVINKITPEVKTNIYPYYGYEDTSKIKDVLSKSTPEDQLAIFGHHGNRYLGIDNEWWKKQLTDTKYKDCYLGSCFSKDIAQGWNLPNFHYRPDDIWLGVNPNSSNINDAMWSRSWAHSKDKAEIVNPTYGEEYATNTPNLANIARDAGLTSKFKQQPIPFEFKQGGKIKLKSSNWEIVSDNEWEII